MESKTIRNRIKEIEDEKKKLEKELKWADLPDNVRASFQTQHGLPKIMQELGIEKKLDKETYKQLHERLEELCEKIVLMIPKSKKSFLKLKD